MKQIQLPILILTIFVIMFVGYLFPTIAAAGMDDYWVGKVVSVQGSVQVRRAGTAEWVPVRLNDTYGFGDMIRVQEQSRAAVVLRNEAILRLDQKTTIIFSASEQEEETSLLDLLHGAAYFFSPTPRKLKVTTPFVNAAVGGTEFFIRVESSQTLLTVFEGRVAATNEAGSLILTSGQSAKAWTGQVPVSQVVVRPRDAVQWALYYPQILDYQSADFPGASRTDWQAMVRESIGFFCEGDLASAFSSLKGMPDDIRDPRFFTYRAALHLSVGRVDDASADIEKALDLDPSNGQAFALQSIIAVVQNKKEQAINLATKAVEVAPESSAAKVALSYAQQAHFDINSALVSIREAVKLDPENALVRARLAELQLSLGNLDGAVTAAGKAVSLNPDIARTQTILGFAYLAEIKTRDAKNAFKRAIQLDQGAPLPRLGLGLAKIREGDLKQGRSEIEIAASLDPDNSLIRSYLGKAYFEEKRDNKASNQLAIARELDPLDPTPWFYDAIRKQTINRPVEALHDLQKSIELNDNRAVYRSRMLLDEDLAARSASLGRIYSDLGFQQLALVEGWKSVNADPANYSAHRFLADSYAALPRHEIARVSELLQSQLLQPINITPIQPQLAESNLFILEGAGPSDSSFNEFTLLFNRNRIAFQTDGVMGGNDTFGSDLILSGVWGSGSFSIGQFHYETDGFRQNNDQNRDLFHVVAQVKPWYQTSIFAEFRANDNEFGDLSLRFDPELFFIDDRNQEEIKSVRLGMHQSISTQSDIIATVILKDFDAQFENRPAEFYIKNEEKGYMAEIQHLHRLKNVSLISGMGFFRTDLTETVTFSQFPPEKETDEIRHTNLYLYSQINIPENITWTLGASGNFFRGIIDKNRFNPKVGFTWSPIASTTFRAAVTRILSRSMISNQTIEPTQVAGFNQFFNDLEGDEAWRYGVAVDHRFYHNLHGGIELSRRDLDTPYIDAEYEVREAEWSEKLSLAYLFWTPYKWMSTNAEYKWEKFERDLASTGEELIHILETNKLSFNVAAYCPFGVTTKFKATFIDQKGEFDPNPTSFITVKDNDRFWVFDLSMIYRLPKRFGLVSIEAKNLFNEEFKFQTIDRAGPDVAYERLIMAKITLCF